MSSEQPFPQAHGLTPDEQEAPILRARQEADEHSAARVGAISSLVTLQLALVVHWLLEPRLFLFGLAIVLVIDAVVGGLLIWMTRQGSKSPSVARRAQLAGALALGVSGLVVARADHYAVYVFAFSSIMWGSALMLRWSWQLAALTYSLLFAEFLACQLVWPHTWDLLFGAFIYLGTVAVNMIGKALNSRQLEADSTLLGLRLNRKNTGASKTIADLQTAQARLVEQEKLSALGRLLAGLSHEINNPVNVILNTVEPVRSGARSLKALIARLEDAAADVAFSPADVVRALDEGSLDAISQELDETVDDMETSARRLRNIHRDLRAFVRGDAHEREPTDLIPGLTATIGMLKRASPAAVLWQRTFEAIPPVLVNGGHANQIFYNLLQNAVDAMGSNGTVEVSVEVMDKTISIIVADTGPGVPSDLVPRLFEPFFTTKPVGKGTGLGLAISRELAERNGGGLELLKSNHPGARFRLTLPRSMDPAVAVQ